jgi:hypothetical protein
MINLKVIVTGTGRCGTNYFAHLLTSMGIPCGHESIFTHNGLKEAFHRLNAPKQIELSECSRRSKLVKIEIKKWVDEANIVADSSYMSAPYLEDDNFQSAKIVHLIRNPFEVISSFVYDGKFFLIDEPDNDYEDFIDDFFPEIFKEPTPIDRAAYFYVAWNEMIEQNSRHSLYYRHNIDDGVTPGLLNFLKAKNYNDKIYKRINSWDTKTRPTLNWTDFKNPQKLMEMSERYFAKKLFL